MNHSQYVLEIVEKTAVRKLSRCVQFRMIAWVHITVTHAYTHTHDDMTDIIYLNAAKNFVGKNLLSIQMST